MRHLGSTILAAALLGAGCTLAPKYHRPDAPVAPAWKGSASTGNAGTNATSDIEWKSFFGDPRLQALIAIALENNRDLRVAALRVEQTQAQYRIQRSALFPGVQGDAGLVRQRSSGAISDFNGGSIVSVYSVNVSAAWEADVFGRIRSLKQEALEQYLATDEARKSVRMSLVAQVATEYLTQLRLLEAKAIAGRTLETVQTSRELIRRSFEAGVASELDLRTADGQVQAVRVNSAAFLQLLAESENALVMLIGRPLPADLPQGQPFRGQELLADLPAGVPSEVLLRRPDVLSAEHQLKSANADIGAARAAFFPRFMLTGSGGTASAKLTDLFTGPSETWRFAPQVTVPMFDVGGSRARLAMSKLERDIQVANYEKAIQTAFREVADALATRAILDDKLRAQEALLVAQQKRFDLTTARYKSGVDSYVDVLLAQQDLYAAQQNLVQFQAARLLNSIALYRSLGGGWKS